MRGHEGQDHDERADDHRSPRHAARQLQVSDVEDCRHRLRHPPCDPGGRNGGLPGSGGVPAGPASGPGPGGGGGPVKAGGSGAMPGVKSGGSGAAGRPARCAHRAARAAAATGAPGISGGIWPGIAAAGTPGVKPGPFGFGSRCGHVGRAVIGAVRVSPNGPLRQVGTRQRVAGPRQALGRSACTSTASPAAPRARDAPACPPTVVGAGAGAPFGNRCPFGSGNWNAGRPALRQNSSGSMPRFLNAASTNGCRIQPGSRLTTKHLEVRAGGDRLTQGRDELGHRGQRVHQVEPALDQHVADRAQLLEHVIEVRVVVDEALHLLGERATRSSSMLTAYCVR